MSDVKRYNAGNLTAGEVVMAADYDALLAENVRFRAALEGAQYPNIDNLRNLSVETCTEIGQTVAQLTQAALAELDQLRAELAAIRGQDPVAVTAVAVTYSNANDDLRLRWLLEGGIAELEMPGQVLLVADAQITDDEGHGEVYLLPPQQPDAVSVPSDPQPHDYRQDLQCWFSLGRASWCTIPRVLMEAMPEEWQRRAAILLHEYSDAFPGCSKLPTPYVQARVDGKITSWPDWITNYRHPDRAEIEWLRLSTRQAEEGE